MDSLMAGEKENSKEGDTEWPYLKKKSTNPISCLLLSALVATFLAIFSDPCHVIFATLSPCGKCPVGGQAWIEKQRVMLHFVKNTVNSVTT